MVSFINRHPFHRRRGDPQHPHPPFFLCPYVIVQYLIKVQDLRHLVYPWYEPINYLTSISCRTHGPVSPAYMNFLLYGPVLPSVILCTTYRPMAPFTSMSLTSVTVSCTTHGPALLSHLAYNLWAHGTLYIKPHICLVYNSWACIALIHIFVIYSVGLHCPQLSCVQLTGPHCPCTMNTSDGLMMPL